MWLTEASVKESDVIKKDQIYPLNTATHDAPWSFLSSFKMQPTRFHYDIGFQSYWFITGVRTFIGESTMWTFWHSMATNWSIMVARTQMEQVKREEFNLKDMKSTED